MEKSSKLDAVIAGARAAATQFSKKYQDPQTSIHDNTSNFERAGKSRMDEAQSTNFRQDEAPRANIEEQTSSYHTRSKALFTQPQQQNGAPSKVITIRTSFLEMFKD